MIFQRCWLSELSLSKQDGSMSMTGKEMIEFVEKDTRMLLNDTLRKDHYIDEMFESVKLSKT